MGSCCFRTRSRLGVSGRATSLYSTEPTHLGLLGLPRPKLAQRGRAGTRGSEAVSLTRSLSAFPPFLFCLVPHGTCRDNLRAGL